MDKTEGRGSSRASGSRVARSGLSGAVTPNLPVNAKSLWQKTEKTGDWLEDLKARLTNTKFVVEEEGPSSSAEPANATQRRSTRRAKEQPDTLRRTGKPLHVPNRWSSAFDAKPSKGAADLPTLFRMVEGLDLQKTAPRVEEIVEELKAARTSRGGRNKGKPPAARTAAPFVGTVPAPATIEKVESSFLAACDVIGVVCELLGNAGAFCKLLRKLEFLLLDAVASLRKGMVDVEDDDGGSASRSLFEALPAEVLDVFCEQLHGALRGVADVLKMQDDSLARLRSDSEKQQQQGEGRSSTIENQKTSDKDQQLPLVPEGADGREKNRGLQAGLPDATPSADPRDKQSKIASAAEREIEIILADLQDRFEAFKDVWYGLESTVSDHVVSMYETFVHMLLQTYDIVKIHGTGEVLDHPDAEPDVDAGPPGRGGGIVVPPPPPGPSSAARGSAEVADAGNVAGPTSRKNRARVSVDLSRIAGECFAEKGGPGQRNRKRDAGRHPTEAPPLLEDELVAQKFLTAIDKALFRECRFGDDVVAEPRQPPGAAGSANGGSWKIMDDASGADEEKGGGACGYRDEDSLSGSSDAFSDEEAERRKNPDYVTRDDFGFRSPLRKSAIQPLELRRSRLLRDPKEEIALRERKLRNCLQLTATSSVEEQKSAVSDTSKSQQLALDGADYVQKSMRAHVAKQALLLLSAGADSNASGVAPGSGSAPSTTAAQASVSAAGINTAGRRDDNFAARLNKTSIPLLQEASQASIELHYVSDLRKFTTARWWRSVGDDAFLVLDTCLFLEKLEESSELHRALALLRRYLLLEGCTKRARTEVVQGQAADDAQRNVGANVIEDTTGSTPISVLLHWFSASDVPSLPNATIEHSLRVLEEELVSDRRRSALSAEERHQCRRAISSLRELHGFWRVCFAVSSSPQHEQSEKQDLVDLEVPLLQQLERAQCSAGLSLASSILHLDRNYNANYGVHSSRRAEGADVDGGYRSFGNHDLLQQYWKSFLKLHAFATDKQLLLERDKQRHMQKFGYTEEEHEMVLAELAEIYSSGQESSGDDEESILGDVAGEPRGNVFTRPRAPTAGSTSTGGPPDEVAEGDDDVRDSETQRIAGELSRLASAQKEVRVDFRYRRKKRNFVNSVEYEGKTGRRTKETLDLALSRLLQKSVGAEMRAKIKRNTGVDTKRDFERTDSADEDDIRLTSDIRNVLMRQAPKLRDRRHVAAGARALAEGASGVSSETRDPARDLRRFHLLAPVVSVLEYLRWLASKVDPTARPTASQEAEEKRAASAGRPRNKGLSPEERQQARHDAKYFVNCDRPGSMPTSPSNCSPVGSPAAGLGRIHGDALVPEEASSLFWPQPINSSAQSETTRLQHALSRTGYPAGANTVKLVLRTTVYLDRTRSSTSGKSGPGAAPSYRESLDQAVGAAVSDATLRKKALLSRALQRSKERSHENARNLARVRRHHEVLLGTITAKDFEDHRGRSGMDEQGAAQPRSLGRALDVVYPPKETTTFDHTDLAAIDRLSAELSRLEAQEAEEKRYRESLRKSRDKNESRDTVAAAAEGGGEGEVEGRGLTSTSKMPGVGVYGLPEFDEEVGDKSKKKSSKLPKKTKNSKIVDDLQVDEGAPDVVVFVAKEAVDLARASVVPAGGAQEKVRESEGGALKKRTLALSTRDSSAAFDLLGHTSPGGGRGQDDRDRTDESRSRRSRTETMTGAERDVLPAERTPTSRTPAHSGGVGSVDVLGRGVGGGAADRGGVLRLQKEAASQKERTSTSGGAKGSSRSSKTGGGRETLAGAAARPRDSSREAEAEDIALGLHPGPRIASERVPGAAGDAHHPKISGLDVEALGRADFDRYLREQGLVLQDWIPHLDQVVAPTGKSSSSTAGGADADAERTRGKLKREAAEEVQVAMARIVGEEDLEGGPLMYGRDAKSLPDSLASSERLSREEGPGSSAGGVSLAESESSDEGGDRRVQLNTFTVNTSGKEESWLMERAEGFDVYQLEHVCDGDAQVRERSFYFVGVRPPHGWTPRLSKEVFLYYTYREGGQRNSADTAEPAASASKSINEFSASSSIGIGGTPAARAAGSTIPAAASAAHHRSALSPEHSELQFDRWWRRMFAYVVEHNKDILTDEKFFAQAGAHYDVIVTKRIVLVFVMNLAKILLRRGELFFDTHPEFVVEEGLGKAVKGVTEFSSLDDVFVLPPRVVYRSFLKQVRLQAEEEGHKRHKRSNKDEMNRTKNNTSTAPAQAHERDKNESDEDSSSQEPNPKTSARRACALQNLRELEKTRLCGKSWDLWEIVNAFENLYPDEANLLVQRLEQLGREISNLLFMAGRGRGRRGGKSTAQGARSREGSTPLALTPRRKIQIPPTQQSRSPSPSASPEQLSQQQSDRQAPIMTNKTAAMAAGKRIEGAHAERTRRIFHLSTSVYAGSGAGRCRPARCCNSCSAVTAIFEHAYQAVFGVASVWSSRKAKACAEDGGSPRRGSISDSKPW
eukprot:g1964.t1